MVLSVLVPIVQHRDGACRGRKASPTLADSENSVKLPSPIQTDKATQETPVQSLHGRLPRRHAPLADNPDAPRKLLQAKIHKAIENRAISGVTVSVIKNITYLDGRVATESQRNAAEQAARSVAGVERVRNRIVVPVS
jgi:BON domain